MGGIFSGFWMITGFTPFWLGSLAPRSSADLFLMDKNTLIQLAKDVYRLTLFFPNKEPLRYKTREIANDIIAIYIFKENDYLDDLRLQLEIIDSFFEIAMAQDWTSPAKIKEVRERYLNAGIALENNKTTEEVSPGVTFEKEKPSDLLLIEEEAPEFEASIPIPKVAAQLPSLSKPMMVASKPEFMPLIEPNLPTAKMPQDSISDLGMEGSSNRDEENGAGDDESEGGLTSGQILRQNRILEFLKQKGDAQVWEIQKIFPKVSKRTIRRDFRSMLKQGLIERMGERNTTAYKLKTTLS